MEDYKKKYEEALERAKIEMSKDGMKNDVIAMHLAETIFPEFQEDSEDERIKKEIIEEFTNRKKCASFENAKATYDRWLTWLEKQGKPIDKIVKRAMNEKQRVLLTETNGDANIDWDTCSLQDVKLLLEYGLDYIKKLEKQGKQKSSTEVKPKFNSDDWVAQKMLHSPLRIVDVSDIEYRVEDAEGSSGVPKIDFLDRNYHLWTIQDAKVGDILVSSYGTFILMGKSNGGYCGVLNDNTFIRSTGNNEWTKDLHPATKEQRTELFLKMHEAGWEWDAEKKEVKKITEELQLKEGKYYECIKSYHNLGGGQYWFDEGKVYFCERDGYLRSDHNNLIKVYDCKNWQSYFRPYTKNLVWSEEDEKMFQSVMIDCSYCGDFPDYPTREEQELYDEAMDKINWLKSIKDRVQPKPKKEWSEEDEHRIKDTVYFLETAKKHYASTEELDACIDWLKSFRPQNTWKPSENQMEAMDTLIVNLDRNPLLLDNFAQANLRTLHDDLKKLKENKL